MSIFLSFFSNHARRISRDQSWKSRLCDGFSIWELDSRLFFGRIHILIHEEDCVAALLGRTFALPALSPPGSASSSFFIAWDIQRVRHTSWLPSLLRQQLLKSSFPPPLHLRVFRWWFFLAEEWRGHGSLPLTWMGPMDTPKTTGARATELAMVILNSTKWILPGTHITRSISLSSPKCPRPTTVMRGFTRSHLHDSLNNSIRTRNQLTPTSPSRSVFFSLLPPSSHLLAPPVNLPRREGGEGECQEKTRLHTFFLLLFFIIFGIPLLLPL